jgi:hypothetical protein
VAGVDPFIGTALPTLYGDLRARCAALSNGDGARSGAERMFFAANHSDWLTVTESHRGPIRGQGVLPVRVPALPPRPELRRHRSGRQFLRFSMPGTPDFRGEMTSRGVSLPHCSIVWSITLRNWRLMKTATATDEGRGWHPGPSESIPEQHTVPGEGACRYAGVCAGSGSARATG